MPNNCEKLTIGGRALNGSWKRQNAGERVRNVLGRSDAVWKKYGPKVHQNAPKLMR